MKHLILIIATLFNLSLIAQVKPVNTVIIPKQAGNAGKYLKTNGSQLSWATVSGSGSSNDTIFKSLGTLFLKTAFTNTLDFRAKGGVIATYTNGCIDVSGGTGDFTKSLAFYKTSMLDHWRIEVKYVIKSATSGSNYGLAIGKLSTNSHGDYYSNDLRVNGAAATSQLYLTINGVQFLSGGSVTQSVNDTILLTLERQSNYMVGTAKNLNNNSFAFTTYTFSLTGAGQTLDNTGDYSLYALGGTSRVCSVKLFSNTQKEAPLCFVGDSKMVGYYCTSINKRVNNLFQNVPIHAGGSDLTADVLKSIDEIILMKPKNVILSIGSNDVRYSVNTDSLHNRYTRIVNILQNAGIPVYHMVLPESTLLAFKNWVYTTFPYSKIIDVYDRLNNNLCITISDGIHLTDDGNREIFSYIISKNIFNVNVNQ